MPYTERPYIPARDPLSAIPPSRHPFQFWVMFACALAGAANLFVTTSEAAEQIVNPTFAKVWAATLMIGGTLAIVSAWWRDRVTGLLIERAALVSIGFSCPIYAAMVYFAVGIPAAVGGTLTFSIGIAALWRAVHVSREMRILRRFMEEAGM